VKPISKKFFFLTAIQQSKYNPPQLQKAICKIQAQRTWICHTCLQFSNSLVFPGLKLASTGEKAPRRQGGSWRPKKVTLLVSQPMICYKISISSYPPRWQKPLCLLWGGLSHPCQAHKASSPYLQDVYGGWLECRGAGPQGNKKAKAWISHPRGSKSGVITRWPQQRLPFSGFLDTQNLICPILSGSKYSLATFLFLHTLFFLLFIYLFICWHWCLNSGPYTH
jgi:hypothetical protein